MGTGSGKSAIATALGHNNPVLVVVHTLGLLDQYEALYGFSIIKGRQEYPCVLSSKVEAWKSVYGVEPTAADCTYSPMYKCEVAHECPYINAKQIALSANRAACTYRYIGVSRLMKERKGNIVLDEAHDAAEELIRFNEFTYKTSFLYKYKLQPFPITTYGEYGHGAILTHEAKSTITKWLTNCISQLSVPTKVLGLNSGEIIDKNTTKQQRIHDKFTRMLESLYTVGWFLQIKPFEISLKALDAVSVANEIFAHKDTKLLMSATIGDPGPLAKTLGIKKYKFLSFAHPVPIEFRPIKKLDVPRMTSRNLKENPNLYKLQAKAIWEWIMKMPPSWRGIILTTSYKKIDELYRHLLIPASIIPKKRRLLRQQKGQKVSKLIESFITDVKPGDIMIGTIQGWGSGLDLRGELARWIVIAGVPHVNPTDQYMKARRSVEGGQKYQKWVTYNAIMQACGRVSRGEYNEETDEWIPNYSAIADGSALSPMAMKYYGEWFKDAMISDNIE